MAAGTEFPTTAYGGTYAAGYELSDPQEGAAETVPVRDR